MLSESRRLPTTLSLRPQVAYAHCLALRARNVTRFLDEDVGGNADKRFDVVRDIARDGCERLVPHAGLRLHLDTDVIERAAPLDNELIMWRGVRPADQH